MRVGSLRPSRAHDRAPSGNDQLLLPLRRTRGPDRTPTRGWISAKIEQPSARPEIEKEVDVTRFRRVPPSNRTEDPDPRGAASMHHLKDLAATGPQVGPHRDSHALDTTPEDAS